jgi:hypothetical protein
MDALCYVLFREKNVLSTMYIYVSLDNYYDLLQDKHALSSERAPRDETHLTIQGFDARKIWQTDRPTDRRSLSDLNLDP